MIKKISYDKNKIRWLLLALTAGLLFINTAYADFYVTTRHGLTVWTALSEGRILDFYAYCREGMPGYVSNNGVAEFVGSAAYDFTIYLIFALWNLPLWFVERFAGINVQQHIVTILYSKTLILLFFGITIRNLRSLSRKITGVDEDYVTALFCSSIPVLTYVIGTGNYDIFTAALVLAGINAFLDKKYCRFLLIFSIANTLKYLSVFLFIPLILLKNKRIPGILRDLITGFLPIAFLKLLFSLSGERNADASALLGSFVDALFSSNILDNLSMVNVFVVCYASVCLLAFLWHPDMDDIGSKILLLESLAFGLFMFTTGVNPYWIVILIPILYVFVSSNKESQKFNLLLETIFIVSVQLKYFIYFPNVPFGPSYSALPLYYLIGEKHCMERGGFISGYAFGTLLFRVFSAVSPELFVSSIAFFCLIVLFVVNIPGKQRKMDMYLPQWTLDKIMNARVFLAICVALAPMVTYALQMIFYDWLATRL